MRLRRFVRWMTRGSTTPGLFVDELGQEWVVKPSGRTFRDGLVELLSARLADAFGIPMPGHAVLDASGLSWVLAHGDPELTTLASALGAGGGAAFGSRLVPAPDWVAPAEPEAEELHLLGRLRVFDTWIANADRRPDNPNLIVPGELLAIDHAQSLPWLYGDAPRVVPHVTDRYTSHPAARGGAERARTTLARFGVEAIRRVLGEIPSAWAQDGELDDLAEVLAHRAAELAKVPE